MLGLTTHSVEVRKVLLEAFSMLIPPAALFRPRVLFRVLAQVLKSTPQQTKAVVGEQILYQVEARH